MKKDELQNKARTELSALKIIGIPNVSEIRKIKESSNKTAVENTTVDITTVENTTEDTFEDVKVDIRSNYHKFDNDISDILSKYQTPTEQVIYHRLYRLSYGYNRNTCRVGMGSLAKACNIGSSEKTVKRAIQGLVEKGHIAVDDKHRNSKLGTKYRVFLPREIPDIKSQTVVESTTVKNATVNSTTVKNTTPTPVKITTVKNTTVAKSPVNKEPAPTVVISTVVDSTGTIDSIKDSTKDTLSLDQIIDLFYKGIKQEKIAKRKREKAGNDIKELIENGFNQEDIIFAINWTIKNAKEKPYDFAFIKDTIGQAIAAKKETEAEKLKEIEKEQKKAKQIEKDRKADEEREKINAYKESLSPEQRSELRETALDEIKKSGNIREELIGKPLIEAKENEIIIIQLGIDFPK
jgi:hypothetical protein